MSVYVGNLSYDATDEDLKTAFAEYGTVKRVQVPNDRETGRPRGFAFVEMESEDEETAAIEGLDGSELMGRTLKVNKARPREERGSGGRR
ncbi:MAG: RNA-binding protein [Trichodesmium sp. St11_bin5]|nr:RNA-binding protein [Trichodesmium sp. St11_bin5]